MLFVFQGRAQVVIVLDNKTTNKAAFLVCFLDYLVCIRRLVPCMILLFLKVGHTYNIVDHAHSNIVIGYHSQQLRSEVRAFVASYASLIHVSGGLAEVVSCTKVHPSATEPMATTAGYLQEATEGHQQSAGVPFHN